MPLIRTKKTKKRGYSWFSKDWWWPWVNKKIMIGIFSRIYPAKQEHVVRIK
jgi:hypothetical protein